MDKIIVPIDFSKYSEYALEAAAILAKQNNAEILALHMLEMSDALLTATDDGQKPKALFFLKLAEQKFEEFLNKDYLEGLKITPIVKHFKVFSEVSEVAEEHNADLIIMGSHGVSGFTEVFVGSNTEKVVRHSKIPVLVIKQKPGNLNFETVVFASDFSDESVSAYIKASKILQDSSKIHLLYVNVSGENFKSTAEMEQQVANFLMKADGNMNQLNNVHYVSDYSIEKGILNFSNLVGADLIMMPTHGRKGLAHFFEGSISEDLANHANLPVMTFKI
ncbi:nucleotide-binding universal stress UspA family protein [Gelidibacter algens]|uniref:Nucleotide-binding universal stress UspA family protein n=1 Tax=Gelidibacter algens TaxID=49280 RepID=A0A327SFQ2_9FLAO|nr:universal stress protein [Gelidibacter algens]RAJ27866.1 nucleotide-binding universal stress UspA family protein [Gelidibacter algens]